MNLEEFRTDLLASAASRAEASARGALAIPARQLGGHGGRRRQPDAHVSSTRGSMNV